MDLPNLGHPQLLWLLLALPILYLLSLPPRPKAELLTAHMRQWRRALERIGRRSVRFRRLRFWLLILAATAAILAAADPVLPGSPGPRRLVVLLDNSASMAAGPSFGTSPWQRAREVLEEGLAGLPAGLELQLAMSSSGTVLGGSVDELLAALQGEPEGATAVPLARLAESLNGMEQAVWTLTDGRDQLAMAKVGALSVLGEALSNRGIVSCEISDAWPLPDLELRVELAGYGVEAEFFRLSFTGPAGLGQEEVPMVDGRGRIDLKLQRGPGGPLELRIVGESDALSADDSLRVWIPAPPAPDIALLSEGEDSPWLRMAAEVLASEAGGRVVGGEAESAGFLLVEGGWLPAPWGRGISFGSGFGPRPSTALSAREQPQLLDWQRADPITQGLDFSDLQIESALPAEYLPAGTALLWAEDGPLVVLAGEGSVRSLHCAFQLAQSNLALLPAFPQLLRRSFARSYGQLAAPRIEPDNLLSASESDLSLAQPEQADRPLPAFGSEPRSLAVPLLLIALLAMVGRLYA